MRRKRKKVRKNKNRRDAEVPGPHGWGTHRGSLLFVILSSMLIVLLLLVAVPGKRQAPERSEYIPVASLGPRPLAKSLTFSEAEEEKGLAHLPLTDFDSPGKIAFYSVTNDPLQPIRMFAVRTRDSAIVVGLDICRGCARYDKGHSQQRGAIVCRQCGSRVPINRIDSSASTCRPILVPHEEDEQGTLVRLHELRQRVPTNHAVDSAR